MVRQVAGLSKVVQLLSFFLIFKCFYNMNMYSATSVIAVTVDLFFLNPCCDGFRKLFF